MSIEFTDNSPEVLKAFELQKKRGAMSIGETAVGYAKNDTPIKSGRLRNSEDYKVEEDGVYIGTNVEYAPYIEYGQRSYTGRHMLKNAAANHSAEYKNIMETSLKS